MTENKKFCWLKLGEHFFDDIRVKKLISAENGGEMLVAFEKLMLYSLKTDGVISRLGICDSFEEEVALITGQTQDFAARLVAVLLKTCLIETVDGSDYFIPAVIENTGSECDSAARTREYRKRLKEKKKNGKNASSSQSPAAAPSHCDAEKETEKETETESESYSEKEAEPKKEAEPENKTAQEGKAYAALPGDAPVNGFNGVICAADPGQDIPPDESSHGSADNGSAADINKNGGSVIYLPVTAGRLALNENDIAALSLKYKNIDIRETLIKIGGWLSADTRRVRSESATRMMTDRWLNKDNNAAAAARAGSRLSAEEPVLKRPFAERAPSYDLEKIRYQAENGPLVVRKRNGGTVDPLIGGENAKALCET